MKERKNSTIYLEERCLYFIRNNKINELNNFLTENPIDLNNIRVKGKSLLQFILDNDDYWKSIKTLFDFGLNCNSTIENNTCLFFIALKYKYFDLAEFLLTCEIAINEKDVDIKMTPIVVAFTLLSNKDNAVSDIIP